MVFSRNVLGGNEEVHENPQVIIAEFVFVELIVSKHPEIPDVTQTAVNMSTTNE
jgi:hypothetical protein